MKTGATSTPSGVATVRLLFWRLLRLLRESRYVLIS